MIQLNWLSVKPLKSDSVTVLPISWAATMICPQYFCGILPSVPRCSLLVDQRLIVLGHTFRVKAKALHPPKMETILLAGSRVWICFAIKPLFNALESPIIGLFVRLSQLVVDFLFLITQHVNRSIRLNLFGCVFVLKKYFWKTVKKLKRCRKRVNRRCRLLE